MVADDVAGDDDLNASEMNYLVESWDTVSLSVFFPPPLLAMPEENNKLSGLTKKT